MIVKKITTGFVIQEFDTTKGKFVKQEFVAGECEYENGNGEPLSAGDSLAIDEKFFYKKKANPIFRLTWSNLNNFHMVCWMATPTWQGIETRVMFFYMGR